MYQSVISGLTGSGDVEMKKIEAIIKPFKLDHVKRALQQIGVNRMTVSEVKGFGRQNGSNEMYHGAIYISEFMPKYKIELVLNDSQASLAVEIIREAAVTGKIGDGKIFILPVDGATRIRTGETGPEAA
jgi:nitrogen regulatory protein P-II 1